MRSLGWIAKRLQMGTRGHLTHLMHRHERTTPDAGQGQLRQQDDNTIDWHLFVFQKRILMPLTMPTRENRLGAKISWPVVMLVIGGCAYTLVQDQKLQTRSAERHRLLIFGGQLGLHIKPGTAITNWSQFAKVIDWTTIRGIETKYSLRPLETEYVIVYPIPDSFTTDYGAIVLIKKKPTRQSRSTIGRYALIRHLDNSFGVTWLSESEIPSASVETWTVPCPSGLVDEHPDGPNETTP